MSDNTLSQLSLIDDVVAEPRVVSAQPEQKKNSKKMSVRLKAKPPIAQGAKTKLAPMLQDYVKTKERYSEHALFYQVGDFYEVFFDDAERVASALGIRLTARHKDSPDPVPMCGVPVHAIENYLPKLVEKGFSCVLVSQVEGSDPKRGPVEREISRIITPGVRYAEDGLEENRHNFLASACVGPRGEGAIAYVDVSTGHMRVREIEEASELLEVLGRIEPAELILPSTYHSKKMERGDAWISDIKQLAEVLGIHLVRRPFLFEEREGVRTRLGSLLTTDVPASYGNLGEEALSSLRVALDYIEEVSFGERPKLAQFLVERKLGTVFVDTTTRRNLELLVTRVDGDRKHSLLGQIDYTRTPMGSRLLSEWVLMPSREISEIVARHEGVEDFLKASDRLDQTRQLLARIRDLDRIASRITSLRATPRDVGALSDSIEILPQLRGILSKASSGILKSLEKRFDSLEDIYNRLKEFLVDDAPGKLTEGGIVRSGFHLEVDRLRKLKSEASSWLLEFEQKEKQRTGINGLKVKFNNVFGYFIEVTKTHLSKIPSDYERKQTLVNAERFITPELKEYEKDVLASKAKLLELERSLFVEMRAFLATQAGRIQVVSELLATLDVVSALAYLAAEHKYVRPTMSENLDCIVRGGRHPVLERVLGAHNFVPNDLLLDDSARRFAVLTGPNMGGKSTYLRQVGLIQLLAQAGSFVPADEARLGVVDRIFTRIGAADDLVRGDSTFMVEMREAASIVKNASDRSLVLIDEIGRGTATSDGLAIAQAIAEWLHDRVACKTIFATHFHELTGLAESKKGVFCLSVGVCEENNEVVFTHRIEERVGDRSYGIEVAHLAGLPEALLSRARNLLEEHLKEAVSLSSIKFTSEKDQLSTVERELIELIRSLQTERMTPLEALIELSEMQKRLER